MEGRTKEMRGSAVGRMVDNRVLPPLEEVEDNEELLKPKTMRCLSVLDSGVEERSDKGKDGKPRLLGLINSSKFDHGA